MAEYYGNSRSDGKNPADVFNEFRKDNPGEKIARAEMKKDGKISTQKKSKEMLEQELISLKQNYRETFSFEEAQEYFTKLNKLRDEIRFGKF